MPEIARYPSLRGLAKINELVNELPYVEDLKQYGVPDHWTGRLMTEGGSGDCEDYGIAKANHLHRLGWHREALCLAIVYTEKSPHPDHGILAVQTQQEEIYLDNRFPGILALDDLVVKGYRPFIIQTGGSMEWREWKWERAAL